MILKTRSLNMITKQHVLEIVASATVHSTLAIGLEHLIHAFIGG
jgi:hypothetical protein